MGKGERISEDPGWLTVDGRLSLAQFLWYILPGIAVVILCATPFILYFSNHIHISLGLGSLGFLILISILAGYIMDGLKLYRFRINYKRRRQKFFSIVSNILNGKEIDPYYVLMAAQDLARSQGRQGFDFTHASWIMLSHIGYACIVAAIGWLVLGVVHLGAHYNNVRLIGDIEITAIFAFTIDICSMVVMAIVGIRLLWISDETQDRANRFYIEYIEKHADDLDRM